MLKNILNLEGAQQLSKNEQKTIQGGLTRCMQENIANGCFLNQPGTVCPPETSGVCGGTRVCCPF